VEQNPKKNSNLAKIGLVCLILILVGSNVFWVLTRYVADERQNELLSLSLGTYWVMRTGQLSEIAGANNYYPPLVHIVSAVFGLFLFGISDASILISLNIFVIILILSVYGIGKVLHNEWVGLLAAFISGFIPIINIMSKNYYLDMPLAAMVCLAIYLLLRTECFSRRGYSLLFGLSLGLGLLTKWSFFFFLVGPSAYYLYRGLRERKEGAILNSFGSAVIALLVAAGWYAQNLHIFRSVDTRGIWSWNSLPWYEYLFFLQVQMWVPLAIAGAILFLYYVISRKNLPLLLWVAVPYVIFSTVANKNVRYTVPYLPAFAIAISYGILNLTRKRKVLRWGIVTAIAGLLAVMFLNYSFGIVVWDKLTYNNLCFVRLTDRDYNSCSDDFSYVGPTEEDIIVKAATEQSLDYIISDFNNRSARRRTVVVGGATCHIFNRDSDYWHYALLRGSDARFSILYIGTISNFTGTQKEVQEMVKGKDYFILSSYAADNGCIKDPAVLLELNLSLRKGFELIKTYTLPEESIYVFRKT
jgi:hypothetical protein